MNVPLFRDLGVATMNADGNKDTLLSENGEAQSTSYGSFEDIAEDCTR